ncbi:MAG TPA: V-type ATPase subunit [Acidimicrobiia bacterium]|nr:V-type ATPase subunit [Acidimicrobiia bacterium]
MRGYEYGNTRLRAMRSRLLDSGDLQEMLASGSLDRMLAMLADTTYAPDVEAALVRARGLRRLDEAIRTNLARTLGKIASFYGEDIAPRIDLLLQRWDLHNLRALLRLPSAPFQPTDVSGLLVPAGRLTDGELAELAVQPDTRSRLDLIVAWHLPSRATAAILSRARAEYEREGDPAVLETALDSAYGGELDRILGDERRGAAAVLRAEVDLRNLSTALRLRQARIDQEPGWGARRPAYVGGGLVSPERWEPVPHIDSAEAVAAHLDERPLLSGWGPEIRAWVSHSDLTALESGLRRAITEAAVARFTTGDALGFDFPVAFTFAKEAEARNLRLVGRTLVHQLPMAEVENRIEAVR